MDRYLQLRATQGVGTVRVDAPCTLSSSARGRWRSVSPIAPAEPRVGLIYNERSHHNRKRGQQLGPFRNSIDARMPADRSELDEILADFAASGIKLLVVDGGDGTVRDVLTAASRVFGLNMPDIAVLPSGKTNALAIDLGVPAGWTVEDAVAAAALGNSALRSPIEVETSGRSDTPLRGFLLGAGAFVRATSLAQHTHRWGLFAGFAVGVSLMLVLCQTFFGSAGNSWRRGEAITLRLDSGSVLAGKRYLFLASTLETLPLGLKPFGSVRPGLKLLSVDAPPRHMLLAVPAIVAGWSAPWLERLGYHRRDANHIALELPGEFILDGEKFAGGSIVLRRGAPIRFVVP